MKTFFLIFALIFVLIGIKIGQRIEFTKNPPRSIHEKSGETCYQWYTKYNDPFMTCIKGEY